MKRNILSFAAKIGPVIGKLIPKKVKDHIKHSFSYANYRSEQLRWEVENTLGWPLPEESDYRSPCELCLGIFKDNSYLYAYNIAACRDLKVGYKVLDMFSPSWMEDILNSEYDAFLATPPTLLDQWHRLFEERLWVIVYELKKRVYPTFEELYLWESKRRMIYWMMAHRIPHPRSWIFLDYDEAVSFCDAIQYPIVLKLNKGASSNGVFILQSRKQARQLVKKLFSVGVVPRSSDKRNKEWGTAIFQEYIPHNREWRIVRIGGSYLCRVKRVVGEFASGSGLVEWAKPLPGMLDFVRNITESSGFRCMSLDIFENPFNDERGPFLVNELQTIVGFREIPETEDTGRWVFDQETKQWRFEPGVYHQNLLANLRVRDLLSLLITKRKAVKSENSVFNQ